MSTIDQDIENKKKALAELDRLLEEYKKKFVIPESYFQEKHALEKELLALKHQVEMTKNEQLVADQSLKMKNAALVEKEGSISQAKIKLDEVAKKLFSTNVELEEKTQAIVDKIKSMSSLEANVIKLKGEEANLSTRIIPLKKELETAQASKSSALHELNKINEQIAEQTKKLDEMTISIISLAKREIAVKQNEERLKKISQKFGVPMNF